MGYPGGKSAPGVYHRLINLMPPHGVYCEPFLGGGAVMRLKRPADYNIGVDLDAEVIAQWRSHAGKSAVADRSGKSDTRRRAAKTTPLAGNGGSAVEGSRFRFLRGDALTFLASYPFQATDLVYCDPPYLRETRSGGRLYRHEMTDEQHQELLATILELPCRVMISGYWSEMYAEILERWNHISFEAMTRGGMATEWLWFNFAEPVELHDYRFLGQGNRERTDLRRQKERWIARLERMPVLKKQALLSAIATHCGNAAASSRSTSGRNASRIQNYGDTMDSASDSHTSLTDPSTYTPMGMIFARKA